MSHKAVYMIKLYLFYFIVTRPDFAKTAKMYLYKAAEKSIPSDVKAVNLKDLIPPAC